MAGSLNRAMLIGNLGRDPEVRSTQDGRKIVQLSIATSETWRDKASGERKERAEWHRVVIFNEGLADVAERYLRKGSKVFIEGKIQTRKWTDKDGAEKYTTEIVLQAFNGTLTMLESRRDDDEGDPPVSSYTSDDYKNATRGGVNAAPAARDDLDDEIPF